MNTADSTLDDRRLDILRAVTRECDDNVLDYVIPEWESTAAASILVVGDDLPQYVLDMTTARPAPQVLRDDFDVDTVHVVTAETVDALEKAVTALRVAPEFQSVGFDPMTGPFGLFEEGNPEGGAHAVFVVDVDRLTA